MKNLIYLVVAVFLTTACQPKLPEEVEIAYQNLPERVDYNFHIKPILADRCYNCHGPDVNTRKANLNLDDERQAFSALASDKTPFDKGSIGNSEIYHRLISKDPEYMMPPPDSKLQVSAEEIALIAKWIEQGAEWKTHWAYQPIEKLSVPDVESDDITNEIDYFVQEELKRKGLTSNKVADKERLLRRVTLDLTGLPPTIEEMDAFLKDDSEDAYERVVDRLLSSDENAERLAMDWLDLARYSDSHGVSFDGYRNVWPYRDWVIKAFKNNMTYDQFITKQIAGDLLPNANQDDVLATAFYRMNPMEASEGSIDEEYRVEYVAERTATTGTAFLGLTVGCARCHDHKFDAISHKEFYQLSAFFNNLDEKGLGPRDLNRAPTTILFNEEQQKALDSLDILMETSTQELTKTKSEVAGIVQFVSSLSIDLSDEPVGYFPFDDLKKIKRKRKIPFLVKQEMEKKKKEAEAKMKKEGKKSEKDDKDKKKKKPKKDEFDEIQVVDANDGADATLGVTLSDKGFKGNSLYFDNDYDVVNLTKMPIFDFYDDFSVSLYIRPEDHDFSKTMTLMTNSLAFSGFYRGWEFSLDSANRLNLKLIHRLPDNYIEVATDKSVNYDEWSQVAFTYAGTGKASDVTIFLNGEPQKINVIADKLDRTIKPFNPYFTKADSIPLQLAKSYRGWTGDVGIFVGHMDEVKIYDRSLSQLEMARVANAEETQAMLAHEKLVKSKAYNLEKNKIQSILKQKSELVEGGEEVMVMGDAEEKRQTYILSMGLYNKYLEPVGVGTPENVLPYPEDYPNNRLGLAMWLTHEENPLTSRVAINRYWQMVFGVGIVKTTEDFGVQGDLPSHPELLDWLAYEFIDSGWDVKHMLKLMVMSHTYKQSSQINEEAYEVDPENRYYARSNSYRLPAEMIRDNALAASGLLHKKVGGESVKPYQPEGLWKDLGGFSYKLDEYKQDTGVNLYRRSLYTFSRRFAPSPFMTNFDASNREICVVRRENTNTPLQALNLLNDPQFVEASRCLAERVQNEHETLDEQLSNSFRLSTGVQPNEELVAILKEQYNDAFKYFNNNSTMADSLLMIGEMPFDEGLDKNKTAALAMVANTIFNYDETYMKR